MHDINPRYTFDTFVIGPSNRFAHAAALAVAETPARKYNPLFIYGDAGLGKTHLLQAIGHYVRENYPTYRVRYVTSETFLNEFIDAVRTGTNDAFKRRYRDIDVLLVDDIQFIEGKKETQEEFFHTFNHLHQANRQIVLSSDRPPDAIGTLEDRLRSRFKMGLITDVQPPDLETRLAILRNKAERETTWVPPEVLEFIATNITDNIRVLEGALIRVAAFASLTSEPLTIDTASSVLGDLLTATQPRPITPQVILEATSKMFGIPIEEIIGKKRQRPPRHRPPGGHVRVPRPDRSQLPSHRPGVRWPRPHHGHPRRREDQRPDADAAPHLRSGHRAGPDHPGRGLRLGTTIRTSCGRRPARARPPVGNAPSGAPVPGTVTSLWDPVDHAGTATPALTWDLLRSSPIHSPYHHSFVAKHNTTVESEPRREVPM